MTEPTSPQPTTDRSSGTLANQALPAAREAIKYWTDRATAITMVAIAGAETNWQDEPGDPMDQLQNPDQYAPYACNGFTSWGQWQINYRWSASAIQELSGLSDPCEVSAWLLAIENNARAAFNVWTRQGLGAWSAFKLRRHQAYLAQATLAIDQALAEANPPEVPCPDLVNLLGYLQGDVATDIRQPLESILAETETTSDLHQLASAALSAVNTLETAGKS